jgi:multidrug efflux pump subunit AcrA (membrane-fusion protein)
MVWKILSSITALCLVGSAYFAFDNSKKVKIEKELLARAEANQEQLLARKKEGEEAQERKKAQLAQVEKDRDQAKEDVVKISAEAQEKEAALALLKTNLEQVSQQVSVLDAKIKDAGDIKGLIAQIEALKKDQLAAEGDVANKEQSLAQAQAKLNELKGAVAAYEAVEERVRKGVVEPDFNARVSGVFDNWGFVVLNKGNNGGVFANALLEVKRGKDVIAKLKVKNVEPMISVADVVKGSLGEGEVIRSGDLVVASADQPAIDKGGPVVKKPLGDSAGAPAAKSMPTAPPAASDPFGAAPAPAMGGAAPAPAAPASDPFGAAPAPATPAMDGAAPASDPFGAAPAAPAPGGAAPAPASDPFK